MCPQILSQATNFESLGDGFWKAVPPDAGVCTSGILEVEAAGFGRGRGLGFCMVVRRKAEEACRDLADRLKWGEARILEREEVADFAGSGGGF